MSASPKVTIKLLTKEHETAMFNCGEPELDRWLTEKALKNQKLDATRVFVATIEDSNEVIGYYGLAMGEIFRNDAPNSTKRNMPKTIPVVLLGRMAVDKKWQSEGLGRHLIKHMIVTSFEASKSVATRMITTIPINTNAYHFYKAVGFEDLPGCNNTLAIDLKKVARLVNA